MEVFGTKNYDQELGSNPSRNGYFLCHKSCHHVEVLCSVLSVILDSHLKLSCEGLRYIQS